MLMQSKVTAVQPQEIISNSNKKIFPNHLLRCKQNKHISGHIHKVCFEIMSTEIKFRTMK